MSRYPEPDTTPNRWLFSRNLDLFAFSGSAILSGIALLVGYRNGWLDARGGNLEWVWVTGVLLVDVAHVWSTAFRVYLDPQEFRRRPGVYLGVPVAAFLAGVVLYSFGSMVFWRGLAYLAVFHFVRQQYGWVMLYRRRRRETDRLGRYLDAATIYLATLYPLAYWHAHLPRRFHWFLPGDFAHLPGFVADALEPVFWFSLGLYFTRSLYRLLIDGWMNPGKDLIVATTALCWYGGIVLFDSDYAFTVTNLFIHGIPYLVLIYWYTWLRPSCSHEPDSSPPGRSLFIFLATVWALAFCEELLWDRFVWHDRTWLFGSGPSADGYKWFLVPLLAVPQLTHYLLDGILWRHRNPPDSASDDPDSARDLAFP